MPCLFLSARLIRRDRHLLLALAVPSLIARNPAAAVDRLECGAGLLRWLSEDLLILDAWRGFGIIWPKWIGRWPYLVKRTIF